MGDFSVVVTQKTSPSFQEIQRFRGSEESAKEKRDLAKPNWPSREGLSPGVPESFGKRENRGLGLPSVIVGAVLAVRIVAGPPSRGNGSPRER